jgi:hypothetical protein
MALMDAKRIAEIKEWMTYERELYTQFAQNGDAESLHLVRARVFFCAMRDLPDLLRAVENSLPKEILSRVRRGMVRSGKALHGKARQGKSKKKGDKKK